MFNEILETIKSNLGTLVEWTKEPQISLAISWSLLVIGYFLSSISLFIIALALGGYGVYLITKG